MCAFDKTRFPSRLFFVCQVLRFVTVWRNLCFSGKPSAVLGKGDFSGSQGFQRRSLG